MTDWLITPLRAIDRSGWRTTGPTRVRWITRETNAQGRAVYERRAQRTTLITYEMPPA